MVVRGLSRSLARVDVWKAKWAPWLVVTRRSRCFYFPFSYKQLFISCVNTQHSSLLSFFGVFLSVYTFFYCMILLYSLQVDYSGQARRRQTCLCSGEKKKVTYLISLPNSYVKKTALWAMGKIRTRTLALNKQCSGFTLVARKIFNTRRMEKNGEVPRVVLQLRVPACVRNSWSN